MVVVEDLVFTRRDGEATRTILNRAHFTIAEHEQVAIIGDSGSGKTTLINLLGGYYAQTPVIFGWRAKILPSLMIPSKPYTAEVLAWFFNITSC